MKEITVPKTIRRFMLALLVVVLPVAVVSMILATEYNATLFDHAPFWNDEVFHWHQGATLATAGFNGGYYSLDENVPIAAWSHFYAWGAYTYVPYAIGMWLTGYSLLTVQMTNLVIFLAGLVVLIIIAKPSEERLIWLALVVGTFIPLLNYMSSSMLQLLHLAVALMIAAGFYRLLTKTVTVRFMILFGAFLLLVGLLRPTWTIFLLPALFLYKKDFKWQTFALAFGVSVPVTLAAAYLFYTSASPFPHFRTRLFLGDATILDKARSFAEYIRISLGWMTEGDPVAMVQRYQIGVLLIALIIWGVWQWRRQEKFETWGWEWLLHGFNLFGFYVLTIMFHETLGSHDYRVMSPHLLLSLVLFAVMRRRILMTVALAMTIPFLGTLIDNYQYKEPNFDGHVQAEFNQWQSTLVESMPYKPDASNAWCNTVVLSGLYPLGIGNAGLMLAVDNGIGLTWAYDWDETGRFSMPDTYSAKWMMLTPSDVERLQDTMALTYVTDVPEGAIYINEDNACEE